uniref:Uncharacterized protein n=1 Tax=Falco tinnunculus TaxID=100819 RepID=A0A8C4U9N3_FALTI
MSLVQFTSRRLVSQVYSGFKAASSKKQKFCLVMARPSSSKISSGRLPGSMVLALIIDAH